MKDLNKLARRCEEDLRKIGIELGVITGYTVNSRAMRRWGQCTHRPDGTHSIEISVRLLADDVSDDGAINTIYHELLHTCRGCQNHGKEWKRLAAKVKAAYGYDIKRTSTSEEKGVKEVTRKRAANYAVECMGCGYRVTRARMCKLISNPGNYIHTTCGHNFKRIF